MLQQYQKHLRIQNLYSKDRLSIGKSQPSIQPTLKKGRGLDQSQLLHLPFLVPSLLEALLISDYGIRTKVVPCEADLACANPANCGKNDLILTGDTDLVISNPTGCILFFNDLEYLKSNKSSVVTLCALKHDTKAISKGLNINDLTALGYFLSLDHSRSLEQAAKLVKTHKLSRAETENLSDFRKSYEISHSALTSHWGFTTGKNWQLVEILERLDPRISEFVHGCLFPHLQPRMFLGNLIEDASRASAWRSSCDVRVLAYSLLKYSTHYQEDIYEVDRRGNRFFANTVDCIKEQQVVEKTNSLSSVLSDILHSAPPSSSAIQKWRAAACLFVIRGSEETSKTIPHALETVEFMRNHRAVISWPDLHLAAQVEATLYSLRILYQVSGISQRLIIGHLKQTKNDLVTDECLLNLLATMPRLQDLMPLPGEVLKVGDCASIIEHEMGRMKGPENEVDTVRSARKKRGVEDKSREVKKHGRHGNVKSRGKQVNLDGNMYALLGSTD